MPSTILTYTANTSTVQLPAKEVLRLATNSILDIQNKRQRLVNKVVEHALNVECTHLFGLVRHKRFRDREDVLANCGAIEHAEKFAEGAMDTCKLLKHVCTALLENESLTDEQRIVHLTLNDYRAIS